MIREVVQEMHLAEIEIRFVNKMLCTFCRNLHCIIINVMTLCSRWQIVPSGVTLPFLLIVQHTLQCQVFQDLLCRFTGPESTESILVTMKLLQVIRQVLDRGLSMVPVLCHKMTIHWTSWRTTRLLWRESFGLRKGLKESPRTLEHSHTQVLSSPYHAIAAPGCMACWIEQSQDMELSSPWVGWLCWSWNVFRGRTLPSPSTAWAQGDKQYEEYWVQ